MTSGLPLARSQKISTISPATGPSTPLGTIDSPMASLLPVRQSCVIADERRIRTEKSCNGLSDGDRKETGLSRHSSHKIRTPATANNAAACLSASNSADWRSAPVAPIDSTPSSCGLRRAAETIMEDKFSPFRRWIAACRRGILGPTHFRVLWGDGRCSGHAQEMKPRYCSAPAAPETGTRRSSVKKLPRNSRNRSLRNDMTGRRPGSGNVTNLAQGKSDGPGTMEKSR